MDRVASRVVVCWEEGGLCVAGSIVLLCLL